MCALHYAYQAHASGRIFDTTSSRDDAAGRIRLTEGRSESSALWSFGGTERDLLRVASALHAVDRLSPRARKGARGIEREVGWARRLEVEIAVEDPDRWTGATSRLVDVLRFLTEDDWRIRFLRARKSARDQLALFERTDSEPVEVALFSGGLDSVAGLYVHHARAKRRMVAVSSCGNGVRGSAQAHAIDILRAAGVPVASQLFVHQLKEIRVDRDELPRRTRGFFFLSLGAATASLLRRDRFSVYETGIGCMNMPLNDAQIGPQVTRAMHPRTLLAMEELLAAVLDRPVQIEAPFFFATKGELCRKAGDVLPRLVGCSMSCDEGDGHKPDSMEHCGLCSSCLFRRIALHAALGSGDPTRYRDTTSRERGRYAIEAFRSHVRQLASCSDFDAVTAVDPSVRYVPRFFERRGMPAEQSCSQLVEVIGRYVSEASTLLNQSQPRPKPARREPIRRVEHDLFAKAR